MKQPMFGFQWKHGFNLAHLDAEVVAQELKRIQALNGGRLTPNRVIEASKPKEALLHSFFFDLTDKEASAKYRLYLSRKIINHVECVVTCEKREPIFINAFVSIKDNEGRSYRETEVLIREKGTREVVLAQAFKELQSFKRRYKSLIELANLFKEIDKLK